MGPGDIARCQPPGRLPKQVPTGNLHDSGREWSKIQLGCHDTQVILCHTPRILSTHMPNISEAIVAGTYIKLMHTLANKMQREKDRLTEHEMVK